MGWEPGCRYMVFGNLTQTKPMSSQPVLGFNLDECYISENKKWKGADQCERKRILPTDHTERLGLGIRAEELLQG